MQLHQTKAVDDEGEFLVVANHPGLATITIGSIQLWASSPEDCDRLIRAAVKAKDRMLAAARAKTEPRPPEGSPLRDYDRQAHLAWYERQHPDSDNWPPYPSTNYQAAEYIAQYTGRQADLDAEHPDEEPSMHEQRLQAVRENSPAVQDGPYAYMDRDR